jgi:5-methylcytosine-specific restriction protein B
MFGKKTYNTINRAIEIIDSDFYQQNKDNRVALKERV